MLSIHRRIVTIIEASSLLRVDIPSQNAAAASSDEEDAYRQSRRSFFTKYPTFGIEQTHTALASLRSGFISGFRPKYIGGDVGGCPPLPIHSMRRN
jgi:hypothetical protein